MTWESTHLNEVIDLHVHTAPDVRPRLLDDIELARVAAAAGMRALLLKSHHTITADRATIAEKQVNGIRIFGGIVLNKAVGGLNPAAVEAALALGAREIWMPTLTAENHLRAIGEPGVGIKILDESGALVPAAHEILNLIAEHDVILGTGHLSVSEIMSLVRAAREVGVQRILVTHPELPIVNMPVEVQRQLCSAGVFFERCLLVSLVKERPVPLSAMAHAIRKTGVKRNILATDLGQADNISPVDGMRYFINEMLDLGFSQEEINWVSKVIPAQLLDLG